MCRFIQLEICCVEEFSHPFPWVLQAPTILSPCQDAIEAREDEDVGRSPLEYAYKCPRFHLNSFRCERIFYSSCDDCTRRTASSDLGAIDMEIRIETQRLFREDLCNKINSMPYEDFIANACSQEYGIRWRYNWNGSYWLLAPQGSEENPLGDDPPFDHTLEGLNWWISQGLDEKCSGILDNLDEPVNSASAPSHHSNPPSAEQTLNSTPH
ncbi:hypothetical protein F5B20DRAFT_557608 [Whalleya microplaca]|nr:hypothetical protein F5B20DRAFT_557608 [Whalleya microplaca]